MLSLDIHVGMKVACIADFCGAKTIVDPHSNTVCKKNPKYICNHTVREIDSTVEPKLLMDHLTDRMLTEINTYRSCCHLKLAFAKS